MVSLSPWHFLPHTHTNTHAWAHTPALVNTLWRWFWKQPLLKESHSPQERTNRKLLADVRVSISPGRFECVPSFVRPYVRQVCLHGGSEGGGNPTPVFSDTHINVAEVNLNFKAARLAPSATWDTLHWCEHYNCWVMGHKVGDKVTHPIPQSAGRLGVQLQLKSFLGLRSLEARIRWAAWEVATFREKVKR